MSSHGHQRRVHKQPWKQLELRSHTREKDNLKSSGPCTEPVGTPEEVGLGVMKTDILYPLCDYCALSDISRTMTVRSPAHHHEIVAIEVDTTEDDE